MSRTQHDGHALNEGCSRESLSVAVHWRLFRRGERSRRNTSADVFNDILLENCLDRGDG